MRPSFLPFAASFSLADLSCTLRSSRSVVGLLSLFLFVGCNAGGSTSATGISELSGPVGIDSLRIFGVDLQSTTTGGDLGADITSNVQISLSEVKGDGFTHDYFEQLCLADRDLADVATAVFILPNIIDENSTTWLFGNSSSNPKCFTQGNELPSTASPGEYEYVVIVRDSEACFAEGESGFVCSFPELATINPKWDTVKVVPFSITP